MARRWKRGAIVASGAIAAGAWALLVHGGSDLPAGAAVSRPVGLDAGPAPVETVAMATPDEHDPEAPRYAANEPETRARPQAPATEPREAWGPAESVPAFLDRPIASYRPERSGITLDPDVLGNLRPGSRLSLWMPDGPALVAVVTEVEPKGDRVAVRADLEGHPEPFGLVMTRRGLAVFGSVTAPWGNYRVEGVGGVGALEKEDPAALIDPALADTVDPRELAGEHGLPIPDATL
jgi:hypothetical protein